jgi:hypothetical protein
MQSVNYQNFLSYFRLRELAFGSASSIEIIYYFYGVILHKMRSPRMRVARSLVGLGPNKNMADVKTLEYSTLKVFILFFIA